MRICFFNDIQILGGGEVWVLHACRRLKALGHDARVICPDGSALHQVCRREGIEAFTVWESERMERYLERERIDVIYCTVIGNFCEARTLAKMANRINRRRGRRQLAIFLKAGLPPIDGLTPAYYGVGSGGAVRRLHVAAESIAKAFRVWRPEFGDGFVEVRYEGVDRADLPRMARSSARARWGIRSGHTVVTCLARLAPIKAHSVLLRAVPKLLEAHPRTTFLIAGEGSERARLEAVRRNLKIESAVRFPGHVEDVASLLSATDILCLPSFMEGLPNAIVEAMAMAIPVVASRVGGIPEVIEDGVSGLLVRPNHAGALARALEALLGDGRRRAVMGRRAAAAIGARFDLNANIDALAARIAEELASKA